jgi:SAM-dependent methyltransferase
MLKAGCRQGEEIAPGDVVGWGDALRRSGGACPRPASEAVSIGWRSAAPVPTLYREDLAYVHHEGFRAVPEAAARWLVRYLARHAVPEGAILDLGCGSGVFAAAVACTGRAVCGIDVSRDMVKLARRTAPGARFQIASIYEAELPASAIVAIVGEGLNYRPPGQSAPRLATTFRRVRECLHGGGLFVFDVITGPLAKLAPSREFRTGRDWAVLSEARAGRFRDRFERRITTFREMRGCYRRSEEIHFVRVLDRGQVAEALRKTGFAVRSLRAYGRDAQLPGRTVFAARKR